MSKQIFTKKAAMRALVVPAFGVVLFGIDRPVASIS